MLTLSYLQLKKKLVFFYVFSRCLHGALHVQYAFGCMQDKNLLTVVYHDYKRCTVEHRKKTTERLGSSTPPMNSSFLFSWVLLEVSSPSQVLLVRQPPQLSYVPPSSAIAAAFFSPFLLPSAASPDTSCHSVQLPFFFLYPRSHRLCSKYGVNVTQWHTKYSF